MRGRKSENERKLELFTAWLTAPEKERLTKTQKEFAESIGVDEHTLTRWKAKLAETDTEDEITRFRSHVFKQAMKSNATAKHMELYAKLKGLFDAPKTNESHGMTADEMARFHFEIEKAAERELREFHFELGGHWESDRKLYDKEDIEDILQWAEKEGIINGFKEVPSVFLGYHVPGKCIKEIPLNGDETRPIVRGRSVFPKQTLLPDEI